MNIWHDMPAERITPESFEAVIEISKGSNMKYEIDKTTGMLMLDRVLYTSTHYPENYGFIPRTYAGDGDPLDVLVLCSEKIQPMTLVRCRPVGVIKMVDSGRCDEKIVAVCADDANYSNVFDLSKLPAHIFEETCHFFRVYKELEGKETVVSEILDSEDAKKVIAECIERYKTDILGKKDK